VKFYIEKLRDQQEDPGVNDKVILKRYGVNNVCGTKF
jgi:hypothetical protein